MKIAAICAVMLALTSGTAGAKESCQQIGGTCMEGCEPGYRPVGPYDCFDSVCCVPEIPTTTPSSVAAESCQQIGGTCMEGCEPGYRPVGP
ncbi:MAG: hypothetical protein JW797_06715, partial [Bradymonadales bacterium]|nr:hypothetical protein [Bradymonadales bacterium]